jgi:hypothetical protein
MKKLLILFSVFMTVSTASADIYIDAPGSTIIQSTPISNFVPVNVDYYTLTPPGTTLILTSGGSTATDLRVYHFGQLTISGGSVGGSLWMYDNSSSDIVSGYVHGYIRLFDNTHLTMSGGSNLSNWMGVFENGQAEISGGNFGVLNVADNGQVSLFGSDFAIGGQSVSGLLNIPQLVQEGLLTATEYPDYYNIQYRGLLSGRLFDGTSFINNIEITHFTDGRGATANINLIPEPATLLLLGLGAVMLRRKC